MRSNLKRRSSPTAKSNSSSKRSRYEGTKDRYSNREKSGLKNDEDSDFSFQKYRYELNKVFQANPNLVQDPEDFWIFVKKYEIVEKKRGIVEGDDKPPDEILPGSNEIPTTYHRSYCLNVKVNLSFGELFARVPPTRLLTDQQLHKFKNVIDLYLDFKQKEKFAKLKKLRESQANLPVFQYRNEIVEAIKKERVVIIAGDTGCGKSTQVPQYLYKAGFGRIGIEFNVKLEAVDYSRETSLRHFFYSMYTAAQNSLHIAGKTSSV